MNVYVWLVDRFAENSRTSPTHCPRNDTKTLDRRYAIKGANIARVISSNEIPIEGRMRPFCISTFAITIIRDGDHLIAIIVARWTDGQSTLHTFRCFSRISSTLQDVGTLKKKKKPTDLANRIIMTSLPVSSSGQSRRIGISFISSNQRFSIPATGWI